MYCNNILFTEYKTAISLKHQIICSCWQLGEWLDVQVWARLTGSRAISWVTYLHCIHFTSCFSSTYKDLVAKQHPTITNPVYLSVFLRGNWCVGQITLINMHMENVMYRTLKQFCWRQIMYIYMCTQFQWSIEMTFMSHQSILSVYISNSTVTVVGQHCWSTALEARLIKYVWNWFSSTSSIIQ